MAPNERKFTITIVGDDKTGPAFKSADDGATKLGSTFTKMGAIAVAGFGAAAVGAVAFGKKLYDAAIESQKVTKQTEAVIKSMGNASNISATQVAKLSTQLSNKTAIDDELIQSGANILLTFGKVRNEVGKGNDIFNQATEAALNMSVALGTDMNAAAIQIGKALNDPIKGMTALSKAGVSFTEEQKEQVKAMVAAGDTMGAQKLILSELTKQFEGSAESQATGLDKLRVQWGNWQEQLGTKLIPIVEAVSTWLSEKLPVAMEKTSKWINENLRPAFEEFGRAGETAFGIIAAAAEASWKILEPVLRKMSEYIDDVARPLGNLLDMANKVPGLGRFVPDEAPDITLKQYRENQLRDFLKNGGWNGPDLTGLGPKPLDLTGLGPKTLSGGLGGAFPFPKMAAGGIVTRPTLALIGEAGPEAVVPLGRGGMQHVTETIVLQIGEEQVIEVVRAYERRNGTGWRN